MDKPNQSKYQHVFVISGLDCCAWHMRECCTGGAPGPWEQGYLKGCMYAQSDPHTRKVHIVLWSKTEDNKAQDMNIEWQSMLLRSCS